MTGKGGNRSAGRGAGSPQPQRWRLAGETTEARRRSLLIAVACAAAALALITVVAAFGERSTAIGGLATVIHLLVVAGGPAAAYLAGAIGLGVLGAPLWRGAREPLALQAGAGLAIMLSLSHGLGALGLLSGGFGRGLALAAVGAGLVLLARQFLTSARTEDRSISLPLTPLAALPAIAVMIVAACNPTGWLWPGEGNGYDALSYHLQLPHEWIARGSLAPLEHNVYSYLPSYIEAAFMHIGVMMGAPATPPPTGGAWGLLAADGAGVISAQLLSAFSALIAAWITARFALRLLTSAPAWLAQACAGLAAATMLATPWTVVTGALPYTEPATLALAAAACLAAVETDLAPWRRGVLVGALVGVACGVKMTSIVLVTPVAGVLLLGVAPARVWLKLAVPGAAAGLVALAPWLIRNAAHGGNPVFPHATAIFGQAHWTDEQVERYHAAHSFDGGPLARAQMLLLPDTAAPDPTSAPVDGERPQAGGPGAPGNPLHTRRGLTHPHWAATPALIVIFGALALVARAHRRIAILLWLGMIGQILAWMLFTHLQSRFLTPILTPGAALIALGAAMVGSLGGPTLRGGSGWVAALRGQSAAESPDTSGQRSSAEPADEGEAGSDPPRSVGPPGGSDPARSVGPPGGSDPSRSVGPPSGSDPPRSVGPPSVGPPETLRAWLLPGAVTAALLIQSLAVVARYRDQRGGEPNAWLALGPPAFSGSVPELAQFADESPQGLIAGALPPDARIYLLADSTPFYYLRNSIYTTTWDRSILARAIEQHPGDPAAWRRALRDAGAEWVLLNERERQRLAQSGFLDPALTEDNIVALLSQDTRLQATWAESGQSLFRLLAPSRQSPPGPGPGATPGQQSPP